MQSNAYVNYNKNNQRRFVPKNFDDIRENDLIIGYESSPTKQVVTLCICSYPGVRKLGIGNSHICDIQAFQILCKHIAISKYFNCKNRC